jgi:hypothetical protein
MASFYILFRCSLKRVTNKFLREINFVDTFNITYTTCLGKKYIGVLILISDRYRQEQQNCYVPFFF